MLVVLKYAEYFIVLDHTGKLLPEPLQDFVEMCRLAGNYCYNVIPFADQAGDRSDVFVSFQVLQEFLFCLRAQVLQGKADIIEKGVAHPGRVEDGLEPKDHIGINHPLDPFANSVP